MPTIHRVRNMRLHMFPNDHEPAHFHVLAPDFAAKVVIGSWAVLPMVGKPRGLEAVLDWARANEALMRERWRETRGEP